MPTASSFRDPLGHVTCVGDRVLRELSPSGWEQAEKILAHPYFRKHVVNGNIVETFIPDDNPTGVEHCLEHRAIAPISFPYEWPFALLRKAALFHLDLQLEGLDQGISFRDASAYNIAFIGPKPVFIDVLSLGQYQDREIWFGRDQFLKEFLNPLLLASKCRMDFQPLYRALLSGIPHGVVARTYPASAKLGLFYLLNYGLPRFLQKRTEARPDTGPVTPQPLPRKLYRRMLESLRSVIQGLTYHQKHSEWSEYSQDNFYDDRSRPRKQRLIGAFVSRVKPRRLLDIGCNTGEYAALACREGAGGVVGYETDQVSLNVAVARAEAENLQFLPLYQDLANPSPGQGWELEERPDIFSRTRFDAVMALAVIHHLCIAKNLPLAMVIRHIVSRAPVGIIEFVPKSDPGAKALLKYRNDIFPDYTLDCFKKALSQHAVIEQEERIEGSERRMFMFRSRKT